MFGKSLPDDSPLLAERKRERELEEKEKDILSIISSKNIYIIKQESLIVLCLKQIIYSYKNVF